MSKNWIIVYELNKIDNYSQSLDKILNNIRSLNKAIWNPDVKYRTSFGNKLTDLQSIYYLERGKWVDFILFNPFTIEELISDKLGKILQLFWQDIVNKLCSNDVIKLQLKLNLTFTIESTDNSNIDQTFQRVRSIGSIILVRKENYSEALSHFTVNLYLSLDTYSSFYIKNIILTYNICYEDSELNNLSISTNEYHELNENHTQNIMLKNNELLKIQDKNLPLTTDLTQWGDIKIIKGDYPYKFNLKETRIFIKSKDNSLTNYNYIVSIRGFLFKGRKVLLHRVSLTKSFITMDLETKDINGTLVPYCVSIFDGKEANSFYITDYKSSDDMLEASIRFVLKRKYNKHRIYLHNFSYFDGIFLMKIISNVVDCKNIIPVIRDGRIINLRIGFDPVTKDSKSDFKETNKNKNKYYVEFRDSYLLLTTSLDKLGKTFAINKGKLERKLPFPFRFVNEPHVNYNYVGPVPSYKYYDKISEVEYNNLILSESKDTNKWDLKKESIYYCEQDCRTLYYAILEFSKLIYLQFNVDI